jgi:oxalyl-CoA decarboxylase
MDSGKPTLINAVIDPAAGKESGNIGNLNPTSVVSKNVNHEVIEILKQKAAQ